MVGWQVSRHVVRRSQRDLANPYRLASVIESPTTTSDHERLNLML